MADSTPRRNISAAILVAIAAAILTLRAGWLGYAFYTTSPEALRLTMLSSTHVFISLFFAILFWGLVSLALQSGKTASGLGVLFYLVLQISMVAAVGDRAKIANQARGLTFGQKGWLMPMSLITSTSALSSHMIMIGLLLCARNTDRKSTAVTEGSNSAGQLGATGQLRGW